MRKKQEEDAFSEALASMKYLVRHRGPVQIMGKRIEQFKIGKKTFYLDNQVPALIQDTFANLGYEQRDGTKPVLAAKRRTEHGWHLIWNLPPGVSFNQVRQDTNFFEDAVNSYIALDWKHGKLHMNIQTGELPPSALYEWDPDQYPDMELPVPVGHSRTGLHVFDLCDSPHLLVGGSTGFGKTAEIRAIVHSLIHKAIIVIIDLKQIDFYYLKDNVILALTDEEAYQVMLALNQEYERRIEILKRNRAVKIQECAEKLPYIVVVVDELAEIKNKDTIALMDRLVRLARATGISIIGASQRTSTQVIPGDTRSNFVARMCFKVPNPADSRVILGEDCGLAGELPSVKGRCIFRFGIDTMELQSMFLPLKQAEELALSTPKIRGWDYHVRECQPKTKRLAPR